MSSWCSQHTLGWLHLRFLLQSVLERPHLHCQFPRLVSHTLTRVLQTSMNKHIEWIYRVQAQTSASHAGGQNVARLSPFLLIFRCFISKHLHHLEQNSGSQRCPLTHICTRIHGTIIISDPRTLLQTGCLLSFWLHLLELKHPVIVSKTFYISL